MEITRRKFLSEIPLTVIASGAPAFAPVLPALFDAPSIIYKQRKDLDDWLNQTPFTEQERNQLAADIKNWTLPDGTKMSQLSPEFTQTGSIITASNLAGYLPKAGRLAALYDKRIRVGELSLTPSWNFAGRTYIEVIQNAKSWKIFPLKQLKATLRLSPQLKGTYAQRVVAAKELSHAVDYTKYARVIRQALENSGNKYQIKNGSLTEDEVNVAITIVQTQSELDQENQWALNLIDYGAHFRVGSIGYINWYINFYQSEKNRVPPDFIRTGSQVSGYLQINHWLDQISPGHGAWIRGRAPLIENGEVSSLFQNY